MHLIEVMGVGTFESNGIPNWQFKVGEDDCEQCEWYSLTTENLNNYRAWPKITGNTSVMFYGD